MPNFEPWGQWARSHLRSSAVDRGGDRPPAGCEGPRERRGRRPRAAAGSLSTWMTWETAVAECVEGSSESLGRVEQGEVGSALMVVSGELVWRIGDRKRELVEFSRRRRFDGAFREAFACRFGEATEVDEEQFINFLDFFVLQQRLPDGRTVVEHFVAEHPRLPEEERAILLGWREVVEGIFRVQRRDGDALVAVNLVDELTYRIRSNRGPPALASMRRGVFLIARLVPIGEEWLLSGASTVWPAASRDEAYRLAAELAMKHPALVFRNPERLAQGRERQREERRHFIAFFGADLIVVPGDELAARIAAYWRYRMQEVRDAKAGRSLTASGALWRGGPGAGGGSAVGAW